MAGGGRRLGEIINTDRLLIHRNSRHPLWGTVPFLVGRVNQGPRPGPEGGKTEAGSWTFPPVGPLAPVISTTRSLSRATTCGLRTVYNFAARPTTEPDKRRALIPQCRDAPTWRHQTWLASCMSVSGIKENEKQILKRNLGRKKKNPAVSGVERHVREFSNFFGGRSQ